MGSAVEDVCVEGKTVGVEHCLQLVDTILNRIHILNR